MDYTKRIKKPELTKKISPSMKQDIADITGYSLIYVTKVLDLDDKRYNQKIIDAAELLVEAKEKAKKRIQIVIKRSKKEDI